MGEAFFIIKLVAGIYLVYLGISLWRSKNSFSFDGRRADPRGSLIAGFLVTLANPKAITFAKFDPEAIKTAKHASRIINDKRALGRNNENSRIVRRGQGGLA